MVLNSKIFLITFIICFLAIPRIALPWGAVGHELVTANATKLIPEQSFKNCQITGQKLVEHTNDPDRLWRNQRILHPHEAKAHHFHVDEQPKDWRTRKEVASRNTGFLVYRIVDWVELAKKQRSQQKWNELAETLYGLTHYLGDLVQPMHLHHDYDGRESGLPDIHAQYETKMVGRYKNELDALTRSDLSKNKIPAYWSSLDIKTLVFNTAEESYRKVPELYNLAKPSLTLPKVNHKRKHYKTEPTPRFIKKILWDQTQEFTVKQISLGSKLIAHTVNEICR